jgi:pimeloyl-ACP methyl ester carboxylesterase
MGVKRYIETCRFMLDDRIEDTLSTCTLETLIVRGAKDKIVPREWATHLDAITPNSLLRHIKNAPHALQISQPQTVAEICHDFIEG